VAAASRLGGVDDFRGTELCGVAIRFRQAKQIASAARPPLSNRGGSAPRRRREIGREHPQDHLSPGPLDRSSVGQGRFITVRTLLRSPPGLK
jgi:hypothetical protein